MHRLFDWHRAGPLHTIVVMTLSFDVKPLFASSLLQVVDIRWRAVDRAPTPEYQSPFAEITFQRTGMFVKNHAWQRVTCDPNTLLLINPGEPYRLTHPQPLECACTALLLNPQVLGEIVNEYRGDALERRSNLFEYQQCPSNPRFSVAHHWLLRLARLANNLDPAAIEEYGLRLVAGVVEAAYRIHGQRRPKHRASTARDHAELVHGVREVLAARFEERLTLSGIANHVPCAPHHLCRVFKQETGLSIHRYLNRLRLAAALQRLPEATDLTALALQLGFASHSHFTAVFRQEFGVSPSELRRHMKAVTLAELRKNLIV